MDRRSATAVEAEESVSANQTKRPRIVIEDIDFILPGSAPFTSSRFRHLADSQIYNSELKRLFDGGTQYSNGFDRHWVPTRQDREAKRNEEIQSGIAPGAGHLWRADFDHPTPLPHKCFATLNASKLAELGSDNTFLTHALNSFIALADIGVKSIEENIANKGWDTARCQARYLRISAAQLGLDLMSAALFEIELNSQNLSVLEHSPSALLAPSASSLRAWYGFEEPTESMLMKIVECMETDALYACCVCIHLHDTVPQEIAKLMIDQ